MNKKHGQVMEETTAEFTREELSLEIPPLEITAEVTVGCKTDLGRVRENNEDKFEFYLPEDEATLAMRGSIFVVCDGMGGHAAGQIASETAVKTFIDVYLHHASADPLQAAAAAVEAANRYVLDMGRAIPGRAGMGTTLTALILCQAHAIIAHVGDSRLYRLRDDDLQQLSQEHTFVEEQVSAGLLTRAQAEGHPYAHVLTRAIGVDERIEPQIVAEDLAAGDAYLLCSDGLTNHVDDGQICENLLLTPSEAAWRLVAMALAGGGSDNCTALIVRVDALRKS